MKRESQVSEAPTVHVRLDVTDDGQFVWWGDSPALPGLTIAAGDLRELEILAGEAFRDAGYAATTVKLSLVDSEPRTEAPANIATSPEPQELGDNSIDAARATSRVAVAA
jgi:hypothetical protein